MSMKILVSSVRRPLWHSRGYFVTTSVRKAVPNKRFKSSLSSTPDEVFTKISDTEDPKRNQFFQYSWGSWIKNDKEERAKRNTKFSIEGLTKLVVDLNTEKSKSSNVDKSGEPFLKPPKKLADGATALIVNLSDKVIGNSDKLGVKSIASIHEGKHHRIYKVTLTTDKELVLRIPYRLESEYSISQKVKSEVATMDFLNLKLGLQVPKVVAFGTDKLNSLETPYILMEFVEGDLLMKEWNPLAGGEGAEEALKKVVKPVFDFYEKSTSIVFNKFGSLYFFDDVDVKLQSALPYDGETNPLLKNRWRIGPSVEKHFSKNKNLLSEKQIKSHTGPWDSDKPFDLMSSVPEIELENLRTRLSLADADSGSKVEDINSIKDQIHTFENLKTIIPQLINPKSESINGMEELFKPRLYLPDLDPMNIITKDDKYHFVDFEYSNIKPLILFKYPPFLEYNGAKIYNLESDIPGYAEMDEVEKEQYHFMYLKTRNERMWEFEIFSRLRDLIAMSSPHVKALKSPFIQALDIKGDKDYLYVEETMIQLQSLWDIYANNDITNSTTPEFPIEYSEDYIAEHRKKLEEFSLYISSTPFAATGGWVPQDMFEKLVEQGVIAPVDNANYEISPEKLM